MQNNRSSETVENHFGSHVADACPPSPNSDFATRYDRCRRFDFFRHNAAAVREDLADISVLGLQHAIPRCKNTVTRCRKRRTGGWKLPLQQIEFVLLVRHNKSFCDNNTAQSDSQQSCPPANNSSITALIYLGHPWLNPKKEPTYPMFIWDI